MSFSPGNSSIKELFATIVENTDDIVVVTTADVAEPGPRIVYVNPAFSEVTGYSKEEVIGQSPRILQGPSTHPTAKAKIRAALEAGRPVRTQILNYTKRGAEYWLDLNIVPLKTETGAISYFASIGRDITAQKNLEERLIALAGLDALTAAHNRRHFYKVGARECTRAARYNLMLSLLMFDLDHFKKVNDRFGHEAGDRVLRNFAAMCRSQLRYSDTFARVGGEEFALLAPETDLEGAQAIAERIREGAEALHVPWEKDCIRITVSVGLTRFLGGSDDLSSMMRRADSALYEAKRGGRNRVCVAQSGAEPGAKGIDKAPKLRVI